MNRGKLSLEDQEAAMQMMADAYAERGVAGKAQDCKDIADSIRELAEWRRLAAAYQIAQDDLAKALKTNGRWPFIAQQRAAAARRALLERKP